VNPIFLILLVYFLRSLRKNKFNFVFKVIYLSIYFSHVTLNYDIINIILLLLIFFFSTFFPFGIVTLDFFFFKEKKFQYFIFPFFLNFEYF